MIKRYVIKLKSENEQCPIISSYSLYGALIELVSEEFAEIIHQNSISPISQYIVNNGKEIEWIINLLGKKAVNEVSSAIETKNSFYIKKSQSMLVVSDMKSLIINSEDNILQKANEIENIQKPVINFITSTSFKKDSKYLLFPSEELIIKNIVRRWNNYSEKYIIDDSEALNLLIQSIKIAGYNLKSSYFSLKNNKIPGFKGNIRFSTKLSIPIAELLKIILIFSEYSGIGIKTSLGMGAVKIKFL